MTTLTNLIERVEAATGADREIDCAIALALHVTPDEIPFPIGRIERSTRWSGFTIDVIPTGSIRPACSFEPPAYTASLDAAIALVERVLPGWTWGLNGYDPEGGVDIGGQRDFRQPHAVVYGPSFMAKGEFGEPDYWDRAGHEAHAPTPALALVLALLRSKLSSSPLASEGV